METVKCKPCAFFAPKRRNMSDNIQVIIPELFERK